MRGWYILKDKIPVQTNDFMEYAVWNQNRNNVIVAKTEIGDILVSTVFLGLDHSWNGGPPILFETMIFGGKLDGHQWRYSTWKESEKGHKVACDMVLELFSVETDILKKVIIESLN